MGRGWVLPQHRGVRLVWGRGPVTVIFGRVVVACTSKVPLGRIYLVLSKPSFSWSRDTFVYPGTDTPTDSW